MSVTRHWQFAERLTILIVLSGLILSSMITFGEIAELADWSESEVSTIFGLLSIMGWMVYYLIFCACGECVSRLLEGTDIGPDLPTLVIYLAGSALLLHTAITTNISVAGTDSAILGFGITLMLLLKGSEPYIKRLVGGISRGESA